MPSAPSAPSAHEAPVSPSAAPDAATSAALADDRAARIAAADVELDAVAARTLDRLRRQQPELFDARGRLRQRALRQFLAAHAAGQTLLTKAEVLALAAGADPRPHTAK
jgi:hypothetical protein